MQIMDHPHDLSLDDISLLKESCALIPADDTVTDTPNCFVPANGMSFDSAEAVRTFYREMESKCVLELE